MLNQVMGLWSQLMSRLSRSRPGRRDQGGQATTEYLGLAALGIAAIVVIGAALRVLGLDVVDWIRVQVGV